MKHVNQAKQLYIPIEIYPIALVMENRTLIGSKTDVVISTTEVTVEAYQNGFEDAEEEDWTVSFD